MTSVTSATSIAKVLFIWKKQKRCHTSKSSLLSIALQPRLLENWLLSLGLKSQIHISRLQLLLQWLNHFIFAQPFAEKALQANQNSMTAFLAKLGISGMLVVDKLHFRGHKVAPSVQFHCHSVTCINDVGRILHAELQSEQYTGS